MPVQTFTKTGNKATTAAKLDKSVFGVEVKNHELLKQAYLTYLDNGRLNLAVVKTRGEVRGGGRKPWKQKGTGRARFGSSRNPIWRGGGITFGPTGLENYSKDLATKTKRQAICQALSLAANADKLIVIESVDAKSGKTADLAKLLDKIKAGQNTLIVVNEKSPELMRASKNLPGVNIVKPQYLSVYTVLNSDSLVISQDSIAEITKWLSRETKK